MQLFFDISEKRNTFAPANGKFTESSALLQRKARKQKAGCSSVRLEYTSGGREVAGSNPVTPTFKRTTLNF